ncbi:MBL fold metallo-hydrolase [Gordonia sp. PP30]|uniref:MBL fold metallo-hydrolase n=1 Tax=unclassified Gordonia (in: high G+C Gram-positive bacteria) TaxID=2657482 RepID=UPI001FFF4D29|nr:MULTISPECIES: MBL fold metallo-hydrolase [unclassified Gordonia (in: high G+C Gram-positive bacteria)]UQE75786.1 MBL fold metallo-hydrolase [Gordonia sp. PP30]
MTSIRSILLDGVAEPVGSAILRTRSATARLAAATSARGEAAAVGAVDRLAARGVGPARALGADAKTIAPFTARSPFATDGVFANREAAFAGPGPGVGTFVEMARRPGRPGAPIPVTTPRFDAEPATLAATWLGHASVLVELDGARILTDPVFSARCSPSQVVGPARMHPAPSSVGALPPIDVVLLSHDHYDHLDTATIDALAALHPQARFVVPIGVDAHLIAWGVDPARIFAADWYEHIDLDVHGKSYRFHATAARHFSGRGLIRNLTQWVSWAVVGPDHRFFFSGDTGFTERYAEIGDLVGPFDLTLIAVGAYGKEWPDIHINPEEALSIHHLLNPGAAHDSLLLPIHWGTFNLALHPWAEPIQRLLSASGTAGVGVCVPRPGDSVDVRKRNGTAYDDPTWWERCA